MEGWVKIHSKMLRWEWYTDTNTKVVFLHCLLKANFEEKIWRGTLIERGQFIDTVASIAGEVNLTPAQVRNALEKLKSTGEISIKTTNKNSIITITNYESYQSVGSKQQQTKRQSNIKSNNNPPLYSNLNINFDNTQTDKENISSLKSSDIQKNPSLYDNADFQPEKIETEDDVFMKRYQNFLVELPKNWPHVCKVRDQLTFEEFRSIRKAYKYEEIKECLTELNDWPDFAKKRNTVYRSLLAELKKKYGERTTTMG